MATPTDNSNITDEQVYQAKIDLKNAKIEESDLVSDIIFAKKRRDPLKSQAFPPIGGTTSVGALAILADWQAVPNTADGHAVKSPKAYSFNAAELAAWSSATTGTYGGNPPSYVWVQEYDSKYGASYLPSTYAFNSSFYSAVTVSGAQPNGKNYFLLNAAQSEYWGWQNLINKKTARVTYLRLKIKQYQYIINNAPEISLINTDGTLSLNKFFKMVYNVGSVKEAYFTSNKEFFSELTTLYTGNTPNAITNASQLWANGSSNKGMIQPYTALASQNDLPEEVVLPTASAAYNAKTKKIDPTGFQFLYNPASVNMMYSGQLGVDPNMETTGIDQFNPFGVYSQATVDFNILINRMFDFKYYDKTTGVIADAYKNKSDLYYPRYPEVSEQKDIFKKGTMYDIEYLLRAVLGFAMPSYLGRNMQDGMTADLGFITGIPVELHLGNNMRYLGNVTQLQVTHVLFDERMVPIFTNLSISFARLIDPTQIFVSGKQ
jgi:hypothetical protein